MQNALNDSDTHHQNLTLTLDNYKKCKINNSEIVICGKLYDIKSHKTIGEKVELLVIKDNHEEKILENIKDFSKRSTQPGANFPNQLHQLLSLNYLSPGKASHIVVPPHSLNLYPILSQKVLTGNSDISTPPPKSV